MNFYIIQVGMMFMLYGGSYALLSPLWGWMSDRVSSTLVILLGAILLGLGCLLVGPVPGLGLKSSYPLTIAAIVVAGSNTLLYKTTVNNHFRIWTRGPACRRVLRGSEGRHQSRLPRQPHHLLAHLQPLDIDICSGGVCRTNSGRSNLKYLTSILHSSFLFYSPRYIYFKVYCTTRSGFAGPCCSLLAGTCWLVWPR